jgi:RNA polymerase sigma-70 factor, ECF subfamily
MGPMDELLRDIALTGSPSAFQKVFRIYAPRIRGYLMRRGVDAATADEIVQETMLIVWRKASLYIHTRGSLDGWIFTIARNQRIDRLRRERPCQPWSDDILQIPSSEPAPDDAVHTKDISVRVRSALATLPLAQREIVRLAYVEGYSHSEIAAQLSLPLGTVKSRMRLAHGKMQDALVALR